MNTKQFALAAALGAALIGSATSTFAAESRYDTTRDQRMDSAYENYRKSPNYRPADAAPAAGGGRFDRAESSIKRGAHRTGDAIKRTGKKFGHAFHRDGDAAQDKSAPNN